MACLYLISFLFVVFPAAGKPIIKTLPYSVVTESFTSHHNHRPLLGASGQRHQRNIIYGNAGINNVGLLPPTLSDTVAQKIDSRSLITNYFVVNPIVKNVKPAELVNIENMDRKNASSHSSVLNIRDDRTGSTTVSNSKILHENISLSHQHLIWKNEFRDAMKLEDEHTNLSALTNNIVNRDIESFSHLGSSGEAINSTDNIYLSYSPIPINEYELSSNNKHSKNIDFESGAATEKEAFTSNTSFPNELQKMGENRHKLMISLVKNNRRILNLISLRNISGSVPNEGKTDEGNIALTNQKHRNNDLYINNTNMFRNEVRLKVNEIPIRLTLSDREGKKVVVSAVFTPNKKMYPSLRNKGSPSMMPADQDISMISNNGSNANLTLKLPIPVVATKLQSEVNLVPRITDHMLQTERVYRPTRTRNIVSRLNIQNLPSSMTSTSNTSTSTSTSTTTPTSTLINPAVSVTNVLDTSTIATNDIYTGISHTNLKEIYLQEFDNTSDIYTVNLGSTYLTNSTSSLKENSSTTLIQDESFNFEKLIRNNGFENSIVNNADVPPFLQDIISQIDDRLANLLRETVLKYVSNSNNKTQNVTKVLESTTENEILTSFFSTQDESVVSPTATKIVTENPTLLEGVNIFPIIDAISLELNSGAERIRKELNYIAEDSSDSIIKAVKRAGERVSDVSSTSYRGALQPRDALSRLLRNSIDNIGNFASDAIQDTVKTAYEAAQSVGQFIHDLNVNAMDGILNQGKAARNLFSSTLTDMGEATNRTIEVLNRVLARNTKIILD